MQYSLLKDFNPKKSLGQNFLIDENVARKIVRSVDAQTSDILVEIGPGVGALTGYFLETGCQYFAVEIDERLIPILQENFGHHQNFNLLHADFRKTDIKQLAKQNSVRIVGNIPYHITSHIVFTAFAQHTIIKDMTLTVQKEVAERIVAPPGGKDYGLLSVISQTFAKTKLLFTLSKHVFRPKPEVDSAVVQWRMQAPPLEILNEPFFLKMIKTAFAQRRKTLRRSLSQFLKTSQNSAPDSIDLQRRPETLSVKEIILLANSLTPIKQ